MTIQLPQGFADDGNNAAPDPSGKLRQMIAVLEAERQALATLEAGNLAAVTDEKSSLCDQLMAIAPNTLGEETRALAQTAKSLNDANRRVRNLLAANVTARLDALGAERPGRHAYKADMGLR